MYHYKLFLKLKQENKKYETEASRRINEKYNVTTTKFNDTFAYDFITSNGLKYEVKADKASEKHGNFFIEFLQFNKPSGISITESDYYIITDTKNYYLILVDDIKAIIENQRNKKHIVIKNFTNSVGGTTSGFVIKKELIIKKSIEI